MSVIRDPILDRLLQSLHASSDAQLDQLNRFELRRHNSTRLVSDEEEKRFRSDKYVALDRDKAEFCYLLCRVNAARRIVEAGSSFGVSTLYLAAAVRDNVRAFGGNGNVIATEYEPKKVRVARENFVKAGLTDLIELREGDLCDTLKEVVGPIDFVLIDIWIRMARPAIELVYPHLRPGAIVICDNTDVHRAEYAEYLSFIGEPAHDFHTMTLPFRGGLEFSVYGGRSQ